jgi:hypothetical protein
MGSANMGMAETSTVVKEHSSRTVTEAPASPAVDAPQDAQVETHTSTSQMQQKEDGSVKMEKKSSTTSQERATPADPSQPDTTHSATHSQQQTTTVTP